MGRQRDKLVRRAIVSIGQDLSNVAHAVFKWVSSRPSQTGEEHLPRPLETVVEVLNGYSVANPITSEPADYGTLASQAHEFSMEIAMPAEEFSETTDYASHSDELALETVVPVSY